MLSRRGFLGALAGAGATSLGPFPAAGEGRGGSGRRLKTGLERFIESGGEAAAGRRLGIVTNPTGILPDLSHGVDVIAGMRPEVDLVAVFGPEHGFRGSAQAGGSEGYFEDEKTGLPVYDTYLKSGPELAAIFERAGVDLIAYDIQDVGARFYTFIWTLYDCMEAAALAGKSFLVLDRPNPITGRRAEGPILHPEFATFVGRKPIAQRHGMTVGELARLYNGEFLPAAVPLEVIAVRGWERDMWFSDTGLPWVLPSPNMPTPDTAALYSGTCLFEGTNLSEGRGTTRPFELLGAPYIDHRLATALRARDLAGVGFREAYFAPTFSKYVGQTVGGVQVHIFDHAAVDPIGTALAIIVETKRIYGSAFAWRADNWIDKLTGSTQVRLAVDAGQDVEEIAAGWRAELDAFRRVRRRYLIY
jgi:uncharacterized protein YbbC (DUF1343 family)